MDRCLDHSNFSSFVWVNVLLYFLAITSFIQSVRQECAWFDKLRIVMELIVGYRLLAVILTTCSVDKISNPQHKNRGF